MVDKQISVFKAFILQASSSAFIKLLAVFLIPVTIRYLPPEAFGLFALFNSFIALLALLIAGGLRQVFWVDFFAHPPAARREWVNDSLFIYTIVTAPLLLVLYVAAPCINEYLFMGKATNAMIGVTLINCFSLFYVELLYQMLVYQQQLLHNFYSQLLNAVIMIGSSLLFLVHGYGVLGLLAAQMLGNIAVCGYGLYRYIEKKMGAHISLVRATQRARRFLQEGYAATPSIIGMWLLGSLSRLTIAYYSLEAAGTYALVEMIATVFQLLIIRPLQVVYVPALLQKFFARDADIRAIDARNKQIMWYTMGSLLLASYCCYFLGKSVAVWILPPSYAPAIPLSMYMAFSQVIAVGSVFAVVYIQYCKVTFFITTALAVVAVLNVALTMLWLPLYGLVGALYALIVSSAVYFGAALLYDAYLMRNKA